MRTRIAPVFLTLVLLSTFAGGLSASAIAGAPEAPEQTATGVVFHDANGNGRFDEGERPLSGVRVSNGRDVVTTDDEGRYELPVQDPTVLFVIKPRGYRTPVDDEQLPRFYYIHHPEGSPTLDFPGVEPTGPLPDSVDFPLYPQEEPDRFDVVFFADPQPRDQKEIDYITRDIVEELVGTDAAFGITLGDILFDDLDLFDSLNRSIAQIGVPWYNVIGNHDINFDAPGRQHSDATFQRTYGPSHYSFDYGPVHFVVLNNIEWILTEDRGYYRTGLGERQLKFLRNNLALVPEDQLVVLTMHIPLVDSTQWADEEEREELYRLMEQRPYCLSLAGHTHRHEHRFLGEEDGWRGDRPHHHFVVGTVSGSWWSGAPDEYGIPHAMMSDGTPNGYTIVTFDGNRYSSQFKASRRPPEFQMHIHAPEAVSAGEAEGVDLFANVFNAYPQAEVQMKVGDDGDWADLERAVQPDPSFLAMVEREQRIEDRPWRDPPDARDCPHLWRGRLPADLPSGTQTIHIRATNPDGQVFTGVRIIRVTD